MKQRPASELTPRELTVRDKILRDPEAHRSYKFLTARKGFDPDSLVRMLTREAFTLIVLSGREKPLYGGPERWRALERLAQRLKADADRVEELNEIVLRDPDGRRAYKHLRS